MHEPDILIRAPEQCTRQWADRVLGCHHPGVSASAVKILSVHPGTTMRVRLTVDHDGPAEFPRRWFLKLPSSGWKPRMITGLPRLLQMEVRFYKEIANSVPVIHPTPLAAQKRFAKGTTLVLSDLTEGGSIPGNPEDALSFAQAGKVVRELGRLHASFWSHPAFNGPLAWLTGPVHRLENLLGTLMAVPLMRRGLRLAGSHVPNSLRAPALRYARKRRQAMHLLSSAPKTLIHRDLHPGNLFWNDSRPGFLDWQLVRAGDGVGDLAYFLATALEPDVRRIHEHDLLDHYLRTLFEYGVQASEIAHVRDRYRAHLVYPLEAMLVTLAVGGMMERRSNFTLIHRAAAAVADHDAFSSVP